MPEDAAVVEDRRRWIVDRVGSAQRLLTNDIADELGVSVDTVRRDLRALDAAGVLRRVHGGAIARSALPGSYAERGELADGIRTRLAVEVVSRLRDGMVVGLDAGTTTLEVARLLPPERELTVVTNSPPVAVALAPQPSVTVVLIGGVVDPRWMAATGPEAAAAWQGFRLDVGVLGVCALDATFGASTTSLAEVATKRALIAAAAEVIVPVQREKLATAAPFAVCAAAELDIVVTDAEDGAALSALASSGVEVVRV